MSNEPSPAIEPTTTVNETLRRLPEASGLLLDRGVDTCCGGGASLREACDDAELDLGGLMAELQALERRPA